MRIVDKTDQICKWYYKISGDDFRAWAVKLNQDEINILQRAKEICDKAETLQTEVNQRMGIDDECYNNDFSWVTIHLASILKDQGGH
jgi:hypothetical protein